MRDTISVVLRWLSKPFSCDLWRFIAIWYCVAAGICYHQPTMMLAVYYGMIGCYLAYAVMLGYHSLKGKCRTFFWIVALSLGIFNLVVDVVVAETTGASFNIEHVTLIMGTNLSEGEEFLSSYINGKLLTKAAMVLLAGCGMVFAAYIISSTRFVQWTAYAILLSISCAAFCTNVLKTEEWDRFYFLKARTFMSYEPSPDLSRYSQSPQLVFKNEMNTAPKYIFVIVGESFSKNHSSLYGYGKDTNPMLQKRLSDEGTHFFVFSDVVSPSTKTYYSFEAMMTSASRNSIGTDEWIRDVKLFDITSQSEYHTSWISNQSQVGIYDNVVTSIAQLSDTTLWAGASKSGYYKKDHDALLIPILDTYIKQISGEKNVSIIHMLGSHPNCSARYPDSYDVFKSEEYDELPGNQRESVAQYDNSILYNDYVVSSLIDVIEDKDAVILYFPDHGQDVYVSDPYYAGHAKDGDPVSVKVATEIPFFVYVTDVYSTRNPDFLKRVETNVDRTYCTENIMYTIADLMGVASINGEPIGEKSLFYVAE